MVELGEWRDKQTRHQFFEPLNAGEGVWEDSEARPCNFFICFVCFTPPPLFVLSEWVFRLHVCLYTMCVLGPLGLELTGSCKLLCGCWE